MSIYTHLHKEHIQIKNLMNDIADFGNQDDDRKYPLFEDGGFNFEMHSS